MKHHTQRGVLALVALLVVFALVGASPAPFFGAVQAQPAVPAAGSASDLSRDGGTSEGAALDPSALALVAAGQGPTQSATFQRFFATTSNNTSGASLAVDANGGVHAAMSGYTAVSYKGVNIYPVYYGYCSDGCGSAANWAWTIVGQVGMGASDSDGVRLALDPQGRPRLMWYFLASPIGSDPGYWEYAECDENCLENASWTVADVVTVNSAAFPGEGRYFALDHQGRPRFIYHDINAYAGHTGTWYAYCDANCASGGEWREHKLNSEFQYNSSLAFTSSGLARLAFRIGDNLAYFENVDGANEWSGDVLFGIEYDASFSLRLDSQDRPRLAIYYGYEQDAPDSDRLFYAWCQNGCDSPGSWTRQNLGFPTDYGHDVDMVIDAQDRPHLAYHVDHIGSPSVYGLGYARCSGGCETSSPSWQAEMVETTDQLDAAAPIPPTTQGCYSYWLDVGKRPSLALGAAGDVHIGYDCVHYQGGGACSRVDPDIHLVRLAVTGDDGGDDDDGYNPPPGLNEHVFVPFVRP